ncbi:hypothetical protein Zmor_009650 [Zophobas morio]|uniref:Uncharacterized protein n=1 Tax=Zophobas morio TaxID=2755281 RepID=A0AA38IMQ8_9CUCU|nr:hypothetical protein Zmor_009650 [Zophobas morio]
MVGSTRNLIRDNIASAKNLTNQKFWQTRNLLSGAKLEAAKASHLIKACIMDQNLQFAKIQRANFVPCRGNFSSLVELRKQILQLKQVTVNLVPGCIHLNPLESEMENLRLCLSTKIIDLQTQLLLLEQKFADNVKNVVNLSTNCVTRETGDVHTKLGAVEGAVKNCKNTQRLH